MRATDGGGAFWRNRNRASSVDPETLLMFPIVSAGTRRRFGALTDEGKQVTAERVPRLSQR
jgi:hypothetical protein